MTLVVSIWEDIFSGYCFSTEYHARGHFHAVFPGYRLCHNSLTKELETFLKALISPHSCLFWERIFKCFWIRMPGWYYHQVNQTSCPENRFQRDAVFTSNGHSCVIGYTGFFPGGTSFVFLASVKCFGAISTEHCTKWARALISTYTKNEEQRDTTRSVHSTPRLMERPHHSEDPDVTLPATVVPGDTFLPRKFGKVAETVMWLVRREGRLP